MSNWFIVQSHSSFENKVAQQIKDEANKTKVSDSLQKPASSSALRLEYVPISPLESVNFPSELK